jgi:hypothetical protein
MDDGIETENRKILQCRRFEAVAASFVALHVTPHAERFAAALMWAFEGLLACVTVAVDTKAAGPRKCLVACLADVTILGLRKAGLG